MQQNFKMDKYNQIILSELKKNARISNAELADVIGLSPSACLRRVQDLESKGVIAGYRVVMNEKLLGNGFTAYVAVGLKSHSKSSQLAFEKAVSGATEVKECHNVTGPFEYLLRVETSDIDAFKVFHTDVLGSIPQVNTISTHVVMESAKDERL
ncbi:Lrp/AsnC family transcriptional regulator [Alteromonas sp. ASW11-130]|uniref:Lrp/AsnC family transcriptional regulator n=1 Tax=Alteromonas sp. ASW11-130 TaxID=3015775 RepID=UPI0022429EB3|nr:Lrp/AsnC family transcriptional regulator [Alteromonas sp. ASW11-130]MCW8093356.1 Lrp/AsnC family transcriptional regulator [Alteromonas sp. ASW11-130]